jgi:hypothetical protein
MQPQKIEALGFQGVDVGLFADPAGPMSGMSQLRDRPTFLGLILAAGCH